jgi:hypothetical protein
LLIGALSGAWTLRWLRWPDSDFEHFHTAARIVLSGGNPYAAAEWPLRNPYFYPLPTALALTPLAPLPMAWAGALFLGVTSALLAWRLTSRTDDRWWPLVTFLTPAYLMAGRLGQWSPLLLLGALWPVLNFALLLKPNLGLPLFVAEPRWRPVLFGAAALVVSLALNPAWPLEWQSNLQRLAHHPTPVAIPGGALLLLVLIRWRRPEARLIAALACVPQVYLFADQLLLTLVARTSRERLVQAMLMWVGFVLALGPVGGAGQMMTTAHWYVLGFVYLPAAVMALRRPNEGDLPAWAERALGAVRARVRRWRAVPVSSAE